MFNDTNDFHNNCYENENPENPDFGNATSRQTSQNFAGISILTSEINPENLRSISQRLAFLQNNE